MDFHYADRSSHSTLPSNQHDDGYITYPPQSQYMSRSNSYGSSGSSFIKKPNLASDEDLPEPPPALAATAEKPSDAAKRWTTNLLPKSWPIRLFLATVVLETIIDLAIQGDIYSRLSSLASSSSVDAADYHKIQRVVIYLGLFAFAHVFQLALAIEAVWQQNTLQFLFLTIFNLLFFAYSIVEAYEINKLGASFNQGITNISINTLTIISHVIIALSEFAFIALGWQIWKEFGWKVYKFLGADRQIRRIFFHYQIFLSLLRFDFFFSVGFSAQLVVFVLKKDDAEYFLTIAAVPLGILILIGGHFAARYENKWLMFSFMLGCVCATVYFAYKLFRIYEGEARDSQYNDVVKSLTLFAAVSLLFLIVTFIWGCVIMHNFGRGLKEQMSKKLAAAGHRRRATSVTLDNKHFPMVSNPNRMSID